MKMVLLQFDSLSELAVFSKLLNDRGYLIVIKDLTVKCQLNDLELELALQEYGAKLILVNRAAA